MLFPARLALLFFALIASCGEAPAPERAATEDDAPAARTEGPAVIRTAITLGQFDGEVTDLAFYEAPDLGFQGQVIAANGEAGIAVVGVSGTEARVIDPGLIAEAVAVTYAFDRREGSILALSAQGTLVVLNTSGEELARLDSPGDTALDLCALGDRAAMLIDGHLQMIDLIQSDDGTAAMNQGPLIENGSMMSCDATAQGFFFSDGKAVFQLDADDTLAVTSQRAEHFPLILAGEVPVGVTVARGLIRVDGTPLLVETEDGAPLIITRAEAVGGNFGGVLRDGVIALLDETGALHLAPWAAAANTVGAATKAPSLRPAAADVDLEITITRPDDALNLDLESPRFDNDDLPRPPGQ
ncbi:MAG: hypothetical protein AAF788_00370 [Pseudomonadota bacterium]